MVKTFTENYTSAQLQAMWEDGSLPERRRIYEADQTEYALKNAENAAATINQFVDNYRAINSFCYDVFAANERDLDFIMNVLTGTFEFDYERCRGEKQPGYRLYLPRPLA